MHLSNFFYYVVYNLYIATQREILQITYKLRNSCKLGVIIKRS